MKRIITILTAAILCMSLVGCITINVTPQGDSSSQPAENKQPADKNEESEPMQDIPDSQQTESLPEETSDTESEITESSQPITEIKETDYAMYDIWAQVVGWWNAAEGHFALPDMADSHTAVFCFGMWDTEFYKEGTVKYMYQDGADNITAFVDVDGEEITVIIDYSGKERDGKIQMSIDGEWRQYMFSGYTQQIAYDTYLDNMNSQ